MNSPEFMEIPAVKVSVVTTETTKVYACKAVKVPLDERGEPVFRRVSIDGHNNLRVWTGDDAFVFYNANTWLSATQEIAIPFVMEARHAS